MGKIREFPGLLLDKNPLRIIRFLGEGAFAEVFLAEWENQRLALKILKPEHRSAVESFKQEFLLGKNLFHPTFVRFFRFGWSESQMPFYTMECLRGTAIKKLWPGLDGVVKKLLVYQLFLGLTLLHKKGLVHRDLKPSNLLVIPGSKAKLPFQLKIMDLGLAQPAEAAEDKNIAGTLDYLAPELIRKEKSDFRADFYACGVVLCELFLGRPPFAGPDPTVTLSRHQEALLPELPIRPGKEKEFWQNLTNRLAAKNKEERPREGSEVLGLLLEEPALRKMVIRREESAADWCRTLLPRLWSLPSGQTDCERSAEVPATVQRGQQELTDKSDLEKEIAAPGVKLAVEVENSSRAYPRLTEPELGDLLASAFNGTNEAAKILWRKTSGEFSLLELELSHWQKQKLLHWGGTSWEIKEEKLKDAALSPASQEEFLALAVTLPEEERRMLAALSCFRGFFKREEIGRAGLWEKNNVETLLKNLLASGFLVARDENRLDFSRPGLREALYLTWKNRKNSHKGIWDYFARENQTADQTRSYEWEFQAVGARLWEEAARQAQAAAGEAGAKEDFKTERWYLDRSLRWAEKISTGKRRDSMLLDIYRARGDFLGRQGELEKAIQEFLKLARTAKKLKDLEAEATAANRLGNHFRQLPDYSKAEKALKKALTLFQKLGNELKCSYVHNNLGATYAHQLRTPEGLAHYTQAAEIQRRLGATKNLASTLNNIGTAYGLADRWGEAAQVFREALELNRKLDEKEQIALCLNNLGFTKVVRGEFHEARKYLLEALELNRQIGSQKWEVNNLDNLAIVAYRTGNYPEAIRYALSGLELSEKISFKGNHLSLLSTLGGSLKAEGQYAEAEKYLARGLSLVEEIYDLSSEIPLRLERIELALLVNDLSEAEKSAEQATGRIKKVSDAAPRARLFMLLGKIATRKGKVSEAEKNFDKAEKLLSKSEHYPERQMLALLRAEYQKETGPDEKIEELLAGIRALSAEPLARSQNCEKLFMQAQVSSRSGNLQEARTQAAEALKLACELSEPEKVWRLHHFMAQLWMKEKNYQKAFQELQSAAHVLESLRTNFDTEEKLVRYFQDPQKSALLSEIKKIAEILGR